MHSVKLGLIKIQVPGVKGDLPTNESETLARMTATSSLLLLILLLAKTSKAHEFRIQPRVLTRSQRFLLHPLHDEECVFKSSGCQIRGGGGAQDYYRSEEPDDNDSDRYSEDFSARSRRDDDRYGDDTYERDYRNSDKVSASCPCSSRIVPLFLNAFFLSWTEFDSHPCLLFQN